MHIVAISIIPPAGPLRGGQLWHFALGPTLYVAPYSVMSVHHKNRITDLDNLPFLVQFSTYIRVTCFDKSSPKAGTWYLLHLASLTE